MPHIPHINVAVLNLLFINSKLLIIYQLKWLLHKLSNNSRPKFVISFFGYIPQPWQTFYQRGIHTVQNFGVPQNHLIWANLSQKLLVRVRDLLLLNPRRNSPKPMLQSRRGGTPQYGVLFNCPSYCNKNSNHNRNSYKWFKPE